MLRRNHKQKLSCWLQHSRTNSYLRTKLFVRWRFPHAWTGRSLESILENIKQVLPWNCIVKSWQEGLFSNLRWWRQRISHNEQREIDNRSPHCIWNTYQWPLRRRLERNDRSSPHSIFNHFYNKEFSRNCAREFLSAQLSHAVDNFRISRGSGGSLLINQVRQRNQK